ncbi:MAG: PaaI family thioesterase, partial [Actinomycetia bacterium]|nr:PaaI family thioesterase [Actinomycetes bacterium]
MHQLPHDLSHGLNGLVGLDFLDISTDRVTASLEVATIHQQPYGIVHGGVYCVMIEAVA